MPTTTSQRMGEPNQPQSEPPAFPMARDARCPFNPPPELKRLQEEAPVTRVRIFNGLTPWLVSRYDDVRFILRDQRFSANPHLPQHPPMNAGQGVMRRSLKPNMFALDEPEHKHIRRMQSGDFRIAKIESWRPRIQQIVDATLDELLQLPPPVDLFEAFTLKVPTVVISEMLGVPASDSSYFQERAHTATDSATSVEEAEKALSELSKFLENLVVVKDANPTDDILSRMAIDQVRTGQLSNAEVADLCVMLLIAGHHTTANMLALSTVLLLEHPDQLAQFKQGDAQLVANTVEECLRFINVPHLGRRRVALEDVEVGGQLIKAGEGVIAGTMIADRDPRSFPDPDVFDIHREARHMLTFSYGVHQCLGQPLARAELQVGLSTLFRRIPTLRLAVPFEELSFDYDSTVWGLKSLPITW